MINFAGKFDTRLQPKIQDDRDGEAAQRKAPGGAHGSSGKQGGWLKRATGLMATGLLAMDGVQGREQHLFGKHALAAAGHPRSLLQNCGSSQRIEGTADARWLQSASPYVNAVASNLSWVPQDAATCPPPYPIALSYTFDATTPPVVGNEFGDAGTLDPATQQIFEHDFDAITASVGLSFSPYSNASTYQPNLVILRSTDANTTIKHWGAEAPGYSNGMTSHAVYTEPNGTDSDVERLAGLGFMLGLKTMGGAGTNGFRLPVGNFGDTALSSVTASQDNACWPATRLGPLDLAFLAARHGVAPLLPSIEAIELDETYGTGGLLLAPNGLTVLAASHPGQVTISLVDDGSSATHIGDSVILLAPGSRALGADATGTQGAWLIGNQDANILTGSDFADFFSPGGNISIITTGSGSDSILVDDTLGSSIYVDDFDPLSDSIWVSPNAANAGDPASQLSIDDSDSGAVVQTANGASVYLGNTTKAELPDPATWIFSGVPQSLAPFKIDLCQGLAEASAPAPAPMPAAAASAPASMLTPAAAQASPPAVYLAPTPSADGAAAPIGPSLAASPLAPTATSNSNPSPPSAPRRHGASHGGAIAGAVLGATAAVAGLGALTWFYTQRRRIAANNSQPHNRFQRFAGEQHGIAMTAVDFGARNASPI